MDESKYSTIKETIIGIVIIIVIGSVSIFLIKKLFEYLVNIFQIVSNLDVVIIVTLITGFLSLASIVASKIIEYRQNTQRYLISKREEPYSDFIEMVYKLQQSVKMNEVYSEDEMYVDITDFSKKLTLWGSNDVIKKWLAFREKSQEENSDPTQNLFILEDIIFEIRKDMGQKRGLEKGDILAFFVNDIRDYISK